MSLALPASAIAADGNAGKIIFREQCSLCHSAEPNDNGGAQGPNLNGVFGRHAASSAGFSYTKALINSGLTWDEATLDRFLTDPGKVVPGPAMVAAVPDNVERKHIIAYFRAVKARALNASAAEEGTVPVDVLAGLLAGFGCHPPRDKVEGVAKTFKGVGDLQPMLVTLGCPVSPSQKISEDWKFDKPGRVHHITLASLPAPFATPAAANPPQLIEKPAQAKLSVPSGFQVNVFATGLQGPRTLRVAPNGDIFVAETGSGRIKVMRPSSDNSSAETISTFAQGLVGPFGIQFYPSGKQPQWLYVAENNRVVRYPYRVGDNVASGVPEVVVPRLVPHGAGGHSTRDIAFSLDGKRMFVSAGSASNVAEDMSKKTLAQAQAWEASHALGAAWDNESDRADVLVYDVGYNHPGKHPGKIFATGIRNCVGLTVHPKTGDLWCTTNERDMLGDELVPDYATRVKEGGFYGWPWYYIGNHEDPRLKGDRPDLANKAIVPDVLFQAHSAALNMAFYTATSGAAAFPKQYLGDGFAVFHGSWNSASRVGHKIVRIRLKDGVPTGEYDDFLVGFIADNNHVWGRPVGVAVAQDGALLLSDDGNDVIYRISYNH